MIVFDILKKFQDLVDCGPRSTRLRRHADQWLAWRRPAVRAVLSIHKMATQGFKADWRGEHPFVTKGR